MVSCYAPIPRKGSGNNRRFDNAVVHKYEAHVAELIALLSYGAVALLRNIIMINFKKLVSLLLHSKQ